MVGLPGRRLRLCVALVAVVAVTSPVIARPAGAAPTSSQFGGTWEIVDTCTSANCDGRQYTGTLHINECAASGIFTGDLSEINTISGTQSGNSVMFSDSGGGYVAQFQVTLSGGGFTGSYTDNGGGTGTTVGTQTATSAGSALVPPCAPAPIPPAPAPNSAFSSVGATVNVTTGAITFTETVTQPGTFSWQLTFQNGKFGVFAAKSTKCKKGFIKLNGKCRPSKVTFGKGSDTVAAAGSATFTVKPSAAASKALKEALMRKKGLPVAVTITFQSAHGGAAVTHTQSLTVKLKRK